VQKTTLDLKRRAALLLKVDVATITASDAVIAHALDSYTEQIAEAEAAYEAAVLETLTQYDRNETFEGARRAFADLATARKCRDEAMTIARTYVRAVLTPEVVATARKEQGSETAHT
jgi:membrane-associated HD superfamily phosphohydrolase